MGFSVDGSPIFAPLGSHSGCLLSAGFNGHGIGCGFRFGKMVADALCDTRDEKGYRALFELSSSQSTGSLA